MTESRISDTEYAAAVEEGRLTAASEFRAEAVSYLADRDAIEIITVRNGGFVVPRSLVGVLQDATPEDVARMELWPDGSLIEIEHLDIHILVDGMIKAALPALVPKQVMAGLFAAYGGAAKSTSKARSSRENGKKGGRPRKEPIAANIA